jgi:DnaJ-class molecular chaperone
MEWLPYGPMEKDYYAILGVNPSAEEAVISATYRALAKLCHPDAYKGGNAAERMAKIYGAHATGPSQQRASFGPCFFNSSSRSTTGPASTPA